MSSKRWRLSAVPLVIGLALAAGCGPVKVTGGGQEAAPVAVRPAKTISFEVEQTRIPSLRPQAGHGKELYNQVREGGSSCASCHGRDGKPKVAGAPDFSDAAWIRNKPPLELEAFLREGQGHTYGDVLSLQDRWDILAYLRFEVVPVAPGEAGDPGRAATLREAKTALFGKNCNVCHGNRGDGNGFLAPTMQPLPRKLTDYEHWGTIRTDQEIYDNIYYGVHWSAMPPWRGVLEPNEIWSIVDFIRSLQYDPPETD